MKVLFRRSWGALEVQQLIMCQHRRTTLRPQRLVCYVYSNKYQQLPTPFAVTEPDATCCFADMLVKHLMLHNLLQEYVENMEHLGSGTPVSISEMLSAFLLCRMAKEQ
jgi:hypothetical protein